MNILCDVLLIALAANAMLTAWFDGSIFAKWRATLELRDDKFSELMSCPLCLSYHFAFWLTLLLFIGQFIGYPWSGIVRLPIMALAATDVVHWLWRIPNSTENNHESGTSTQDKAGDPAEVRQERS